MFATEPKASFSLTQLIGTFASAFFGVTSAFLLERILNAQLGASSPTVYFMRALVSIVRIDPIILQPRV
jgi:hypothetical protein